MKYLLPFIFVLLFTLHSTAQPLPDKIEAVKLVMAAYGYTYVDYRTCTIQKNGQCYFSRNFSGSYLVMAVGEDGLYDLDLFAYDTSGRRYSEDTSVGEYPALSFNKIFSGTLTIYCKNVNSYSNTHDYAVAIMIGYK